MSHKKLWTTPALVTAAGTISYDATNMELPLGQPITITKANVDQYAGG